MAISGESLQEGRYELEEVLGTGAFSTVQRAVDRRLQDVVAIKILAENHSLNPDLRERFLTEGRALRRVNSENLLTVYDLGETSSGQPFLVLEYADGGTLADRVEGLRARGWRPSGSEIVAVAQMVGGALAELHGAGIVHRDLNPRNILIASRSQASDTVSGPLLGAHERLLVGDLGLCKDLARHSGYTVAAGTDGFRAPELRRGPTIVSPNADLWSLAAVIYWMLTGRRADGSEVASELHLAGVAPAVARVVCAGLCENPDDRPQDPERWVGELSAAVGAAALPPPPAAPGPPPAAPVPPPVAASPPTPQAATASPGWLRHSLWLLTTLPLGVTTWAGFAYIGVRAKRPAWLVAAAIYALGLVLMFVLLAYAPRSPDGTVEDSSWQSTVATLLIMAVWFGGILHGLLVNPAWRRFRTAAAGTS